MTGSHTLVHPPSFLPKLMSQYLGVCVKEAVKTLWGHLDSDITHNAYRYAFKLWWMGLGGCLALPNFSPKHTPTNVFLILSPARQLKHFSSLIADVDFPLRCSAFWAAHGHLGFPKKKYCSGLVPVRTLSPALSNVAIKNRSTDSRQQEDTLCVCILLYLNQHKQHCAFKIK